MVSEKAARSKLLLPLQGPSFERTHCHKPKVAELSNPSPATVSLLRLVPDQHVLRLQVTMYEQWGAAAQVDHTA